MSGRDLVGAAREATLAYRDRAYLYGLVQDLATALEEQLAAGSSAPGRATSANATTHVRGGYPIPTSAQTAAPGRAHEDALREAVLLIRAERESHQRTIDSGVNSDNRHSYAARDALDFALSTLAAVSGGAARPPADVPPRPAADKTFQMEGGGTRHWIREHFIAELASEGLVVALAARVAALEHVAELADNFVDAHESQRGYREDYEWPGDAFRALRDALAGLDGQA